MAVRPPHQGGSLVSAARVVGATPLGFRAPGGKRLLAHALALHRTIYENRRDAGVHVVARVSRGRSLNLPSEGLLWIVHPRKIRVFVMSSCLTDITQRYPLVVRPLVGTALRKTLTLGPASGALHANGSNARRATSSWFRDFRGLRRYQRRVGPALIRPRGVRQVSSALGGWWRGRKGGRRWP